ncbi:Two component transcriptional regulator, winged helix family protein [Sulfitobacter noctilucae]|uniref:response regulator n=1 Tax=Sulfitobacter noctilucae TaxID=1342302 RepID=UPI000468D12D|nr:response regulator [Sulfitobacter noctilucae]KIN60492.1 Two component transcriptional regulator, winged helix family protein [Sulfitobacter noctilucae]
MRLLAVDDDPLILDLLQTIFAQADLPDISVAPSGIAGLAMLEDPDFEVDGLILDITMPGMSGIDLCKAVRQMPRHRHKPILMLTSVTDITTVENAFAAGADDYVTKPFDVKEIVARVRVAERMVEKASPLSTVEPTERPEEQVAGQHAIDIAEPLRIAELANLIHPFALGNYLAQLSRRKVDRSTIFAVHLSQISDIFAKCTTAELSQIVKGVGEAINTAVGRPRLLMAYEGNGMFICILPGSEALEWPLVEHQIQAALNAQHLLNADGTERRIDVSVGNPVTPSASRFQRVNRTFDRTRERALSRSRSKGSDVA